jgi:26S proteasome regulatory subunit T5
MSTLEDLDDLERDGKKEDNNDDTNKKPADAAGDNADMKDADAKKDENDEEQDAIDMEILNSSTRDIVSRRRLLENDTRIMKSEFQRLMHEKNAMGEKIKDNVDKIDNNR